MMEFCLVDRLKNSCIIVNVFSSASLISSALIPLLSADFPFFETVDCNRQFFSGEFWYVSVLFDFCFIVLIKVKIFVEFREDVGNTFLSSCSRPFLIL